MKRLFYYTGNRLTVLHWKGRTLLGSVAFESTESGFDRFRHYLKQTINIPGKLLVDVLEEDFRNETIPHVGRSDRKSVVSRLIDRYYRASKDYYYSEVVGRVTSGRKDDIVLISAITNPHMIKRWLDILEEYQTPLSGIWTLPLVSKKLLKTIKATSGVVLLVSQQVSNNVRQSLFRNGKFITSRQSIVNVDQGDSSDIGKRTAKEVKRTIDFLRAQGSIDSDEVINVHLIGSDEELASLPQFFKINDQLEHQLTEITIHAVADIQKKLGLKGITTKFSEKFSDNIFAWLCLSQHMTASHYGKFQFFNRYYNILAARVLYAASILVVLTAALFVQANISNTMEHEKAIVLLAQEEQSYKDLYANKFKGFEGAVESAEVMNSVVELAQKIKINSATSPLDFLLVLSAIISQQDLGTVYIDKIEWRAYAPLSAHVSAVRLARASVNEVNFTDSLPIKHRAIVTGRITQPEHNYRQSIAQMQAIIHALQSSDRVERAEVLTMPVDFRSASQFSSGLGREVAQGKNRSALGIFSLEIIMKAPGHV